MKGGKEEDEDEDAWKDGWLALCVMLTVPPSHLCTSQKKANDPSAKRYIVSFECSDPFIHNNIQWVRCTVRGQSFMIHQIRKMIGIIWRRKIERWRRERQR